MMKACLVFAIACVQSGAVSEKSAQVEVTPVRVDVTRVELSEGESRSIKSETRIKAVDGHDPKVVNVRAISPSSLRITALSIGTTRILTTDEHDTIRAFEISVRSDTKHLSGTLKRLYPDLNLELVPLVADAIVVRGRAQSTTQINQVVEICETFFPTVLNHLQVGARGAVAAPVPVRIPRGKRVVTVPLSVKGDRKLLGKFVQVLTKGGEVVMDRGLLSALVTADGAPTAFLNVSDEQGEKLLSVRKKGPFLLVTADQPTQQPDANLHQQVRDLHKDVKKLIQILERRDNDGGSIKAKPTGDSSAAS